MEISTLETDVCHLLSSVRAEYGAGDMFTIKLTFFALALPILLQEECEDLCQRVKDGLLKRPTVVSSLV